MKKEHEKATRKKTDTFHFLEISNKKECVEKTALEKPVNFDISRPIWMDFVLCKSTIVDRFPNKNAAKYGIHHYGSVIIYKRDDGTSPIKKEDIILRKSV